MRTLHHWHVPRGLARGARRQISSRCGFPPFVLLCLILLFGLLASAAWADPGQVSGLRFGINGQTTRVVLDLDRTLNYEVSVERDPSRLVVDLEEVRWQLGANTDTRPRGLVRAHRYGLVTPGRSRLVVDMARPFTIRNTMLLPPSADSSHYRLVIDLTPDREVPAGSAAVEPAAGTRTRAAAPRVPSPRPDGAAPKAAAVRKAVPVVVLDPGHGGVDPGAIAVTGKYEKDIVLAMARQLAKVIESTGRYRVAFTRDDDTFIRLRDRIARARELGGQIFISLHADSLDAAEQRGASVYTLSETASDEEAARLASKENRADILSSTDLSQHDAAVATILLDLAQRDTNNRSIAFADILAEELAKVSPLLRKHRRFAGFAVLKSPDMPSVLLELGYLSNPVDARNLTRSAYRVQVARAVVRALDRFFSDHRS
ncbi:N-acetylmuramoyl-L-alanine amidase [Benzoatithermus flavus]|uniref:N-acetylmuramoyl-L-alanine amidase n=1 Tax=Benzoatithermus flavus TaxID=3108223 RepID=A0ABU8XL57_9PROT